MPSEESRRIRATFVKDIATVPTPLEVQRRQWETEALQTQLPDGVIVTSLFANDIPCERVSSLRVDPTKVLVHLHGGGFNSGSCKTHRDLAARLSLVTHIPVLLIDYRLAPEHPFPAAIEDVLVVYRWLLASGQEPADIILSGDSAGGGLVMSALLSLRDRGEPLPAAAILMSPWLDMTLSGESMTSRANVDPMGSREGFLAAIRYYVSEGDASTGLASPVYADLHSLPPLLIHVGDHELLLSDSIRLAERARAAGVEVKLDVWAEMWHVWHAWAASLPEGQDALNQIGEYVRQKLMVTL